MFFVCPVLNKVLSHKTKERKEKEFSKCTMVKLTEYFNRGGACLSGLLLLSLSLCTVIILRWLVAPLPAPPWVGPAVFKRRLHTYVLLPAWSCPVSAASTHLHRLTHFTVYMLQ